PTGTPLKTTVHLIPARLIDNTASTELACQHTMEVVCSLAKHLKVHSLHGTTRSFPTLTLHQLRTTCRHPSHADRSILSDRLSPARVLEI
ncbi:MAG: hypothetical protein M1823_008657, partial [Watsoniomyces obsoletus]